MKMYGTMYFVLILSCSKTIGINEVSSVMVIIHLSFFSAILGMYKTCPSWVFEKRVL